LTGLSTGHYHSKGHLFNLGWYTVPGVVDANRHLKWRHMFLMKVRLCTWAITFWNKVTLLTSPSAR